MAFYMNFLAVNSKLTIADDEQGISRSDQSLLGSEQGLQQYLSIFL